MHFLVDFENVHSSGLRGGDLLTYSDNVTFFYSDAAPKVETGVLRVLFAAGVGLSAIKLKTTRKNALDFYISTSLGELFGRGYDAPAAIISKDGGYAATVEYWANHTPSRLVVVEGSIIECLKAVQKDSRSRTAIDMLRPVKIDEAIASYAVSRCRHMDLVKTLNVDYPTADRIMTLVEGGVTGRALYNAMVKLLGRAVGQEAYKALHSVDVSSIAPP